MRDILDKSHLKSLSELIVEMPCQRCKKKCGVPIDCNYCEGSFCPSCINLTKHDCQGADIKKMKQRQELKEQTAFEPPPKCLKI